MARHSTSYRLLWVASSALLASSLGLRAASRQMRRLAYTTSDRSPFGSLLKCRATVTPEEEVAIKKMRAGAIQQELKAAGVRYDDCYEKSELVTSRAAQGVIVESLTVPVRFDTISQQKRDETKPTRPLTASVSNFWSKRCATGTHLLAFRFQRPLCGPGDQTSREPQKWQEQRKGRGCARARAGAAECACGRAAGRERAADRGKAQVAEPAD